MTMLTDTTGNIALADALREGWHLTGEMLSHPDSMVIIHIPSLGVQRAANAALMHLALQRGEACLLKLAPKKPVVRATEHRGAHPQPAQLPLFTQEAA
jgi:hypothetical protein